MYASDLVSERTELNKASDFKKDGDCINLCRNFPKYLPVDMV
jgi:hypothetical protein